MFCLFVLQVEGDHSLLQHWILNFFELVSWALSIQPKILEISVGTSNEKDHFGLVRTGIFGTSFEGGQL